MEYDYRRQIVAVDAKISLIGDGARTLFHPMFLLNDQRNKTQAYFRSWDRVYQVYTVILIYDCPSFTLITVSCCSDNVLLRFLLIAEDSFVCSGRVHNILASKQAESDTYSEASLFFFLVVWVCKLDAKFFSLWNTSLFVAIVDMMLIASNNRFHSNLN